MRDVALQFGPGPLWIMPAGAEVVGQDGKQVFYATEDGCGSVIPIGEATITFDEIDYPHRKAQQGQPQRVRTVGG